MLLLCSFPRLIILFLSYITWETKYSFFIFLVFTWQKSRVYDKKFYHIHPASSTALWLYSHEHLPRFQVSWETTLLVFFSAMNLQKINLFLPCNDGIIFFLRSLTEQVSFYLKTIFHIANNVQLIILWPWSTALKREIHLKRQFSVCISKIPMLCLQNYLEYRFCKRQVVFGL